MTSTSAPASCRPTSSPGDSNQGAPLRQLERDRQGTRHRARRAGRHHRQGTRDGRAGISRQPWRRPIKRFPVKLGTKTFNARSPTSSTTRRRATSPTEHDDLQADGGRNACLEHEYYSVGGGSSSGRATAAEEGPAEVSVLDDEGTAGHAEATSCRSRRS
jgi:hypothetical protein